MSGLGGPKTVGGGMTEAYGESGSLGRYPETVALTPMRGARLKVVAFGLAVFGAAIVLVLVPHGPSLLSNVYHWAGWIGVVLFGPATTYLAYRAVQPRVALLVADDGFTDDSSLTAVGFVPWSEVVGVGVSKISKATMIGVQLRDPEAFVAGLSLYRRIAAQANLRMFGVPVWIDPAGLPDPGQIAALIDVYRRSWAERPGQLFQPEELPDAAPGRARRALQEP